MVQKVAEAEEKQELPIPSRVPALPVRDSVVFPRMVFPLSVDQGPDRDAVEAAVERERVVLLVAERPDAEADIPDSLYKTGTLAQIYRMTQLPDDRLNVVIRGYARVKALEYVQTAEALMAEIEPLEEEEGDEEEAKALQQGLLRSFQRIVELSPYLPEDAYVQALNVDSPSTLADLVVAGLPVDIESKQRALSTLNVVARLQLARDLAQQTLANLEVADQVGSEAREEIEKTQREHILRQQLKAIQRELGEDTEAEEIQRLRDELAQANLPAKAQEAADRELARLERMNPAAAEYSVVRTYLEWMVELPWDVASDEAIEVEKAQKVLDEDHYDLDEVKERIVEYLAVRQIKRDMRGPILCFVGPPGVGKTSLGQSIARATGREFVRMSLGGIRDEAEIRGHRRTYVGALPGRIIRALRDAGTNNPVMMLDEVDKIGADFRGDPSSALLEVLDPEQNDTFSDHYLEVPFDLSNVMFICTANILQTIPPALQDRMETIRLAGYTRQEKVHIARRYLIPRQRNQHGLNSEQLRITDAALRDMIDKYTQEAGVRELERQIATVCRKVARKVAEGEADIPSVGLDELEGYLGPQKVYPEVAERVEIPGVVTGLAWTQSGGRILFVEATRMPGKKEFRLTGQAGDVMQESAQAALSYVRSNADSFGIDPGFFEENDVHIHVPAGAIAKDGPSAGVTMVCALVSLLTGRRAKPNVAITGEITLRGRVLPVGGIKEKVLAAKRAGLETVVVPERNEGDVIEIEDELKEDMEFIYVDQIDEAVEAVLE